MGERQDLNFNKIDYTLLSMPGQGGAALLAKLLNFMSSLPDNRLQ